MRIFLCQIKYSFLSFSKFCLIFVSDTTSDICYLYKLRSLYRYLYATTEILHLAMGIPTFSNLS